MADFGNSLFCQSTDISAPISTNGWDIAVNVPVTYKTEIYEDFKFSFTIMQSFLEQP